MPLTRPLSRPLTRSIARGLTEAGGGGGASFSPASLFAGGELGAWYDPSDLSSMFQDTAGTTPVTAAGQAVARINDKSGRGNHATQATAASRPVLRQDVGGKYYLEFDGANDHLTTASAIGLSPAPIASIHAHFNNVTGVQRVWSNTRYRNGTNGTALRLTSAGVADYQSASLLSAATRYVVSAQLDAAFDLRFRLNGAPQALILAAADSGTAETSLTIGALDALGGDPVNGGIYQIILRAGVLTSTQLEDAESFVGEKAGLFF